MVSAHTLLRHPKKICTRLTGESWCLEIPRYGAQTRPVRRDMGDRGWELNVEGHLVYHVLGFLFI